MKIIINYRLAIEIQFTGVMPAVQKNIKKIKNSWTRS